MIQDAAGETLWDYNSAADMLAMARDALGTWRESPDGRAASRKAARRLAFAFGRLDTLADLDNAPLKTSTQK